MSDDPLPIRTIQEVIDRIDSIDLPLLDKQIATLCRLADDARLTDAERRHCEGLFHMLSDLYAAIRPLEAT